MFSILAICNNETLLNSIHYFARVGSKFCPKLNKPSKNCQILLKFCLQLWIFAKSGHTASTINHPPPAPPSQMHYLRQKNEPSQPQMQLKYQAGEEKIIFHIFFLRVARLALASSAFSASESASSVTWQTFCKEIDPYLPKLKSDAYF